MTLTNAVSSCGLDISSGLIAVDFVRSALAEDVEATGDMLLFEGTFKALNGCDIGWRDPIT